MLDIKQVLDDKVVYATSPDIARLIASLLCIYQEQVKKIYCP